MIRQFFPTRIKRSGLLLLLLCALGLCRSAEAFESGDWGVFYSVGTSVEGADRRRGLGPIYEHTEYSDGREFLVIRPLYSSVRDPSRERALYEIAWPVATVKYLGHETYWRVLLFFGNRNTQPGEESWRFWAFPFILAGKSQGGRGYLSVFPIAGSVENFLGRDRTTFAIFPLYSHSVQEEMHSYNILWPFISWTTDEDRSKLRILPIYGRHIQPGISEKHFFMWPIWTHAKYTGGPVTGSGYVLFPLWGHTKLSDQETWMVLPPIFRWSKGKDLTQIYAPWPFVQHFRGEINKTYLWPLWGHKWTDMMDDRYWLWPVFSTSHITRHDLLVTRYAARPLFYYDTEYKRLDDGTRGEREKMLCKIWPLYYHYEKGDTSYTRILDLWPTKRAPIVDRNFSPFWTVCSRHRKGPLVEDTFLWGIYRRKALEDSYAKTRVFPIWDSHHDEESTGWSFLKGILGYERTNEGRRLKLLYFLNLGGRSSAKLEKE